VTDLTPGRALDERVARAMARHDGIRWSESLDPPGLSADPAAALALLDALVKRGWEWTMTHDSRDPSGLFWCNLWSHVLTDNEYERSGDTLPLAICAAVLAALDQDDQLAPEYSADLTTALGLADDVVRRWRESVGGQE
jgi:hypothetical protein